MFSGRGAAWLARLLGVQEVPGSNPGGPTKHVKDLHSPYLFKWSVWSPVGVQIPLRRLAPVGSGQSKALPTIITLPSVETKRTAQLNVAAGHCRNDSFGKGW